MTPYDPAADRPARRVVEAIRAGDGRAAMSLLDAVAHDACYPLEAALDRLEPIRAAACEAARDRPRDMGPVRDAAYAHGRRIVRELEAAEAGGAA